MSDAVPSRYRRPRRLISLPGLLVGLILGVAGGLFITWVLSPVQEFDTEPWQLKADTKDQYVAAITLAYAHDGDLSRALNRLISLQLSGDPIQAVADTACRLATTGYVNGSGGLHAVRTMMNFYQLQGRSGCADSLIAANDTQAGSVVTIDLPTSTPTLTPPPSKTPTPASDFPTATPVLMIMPTVPPQNDFALIGVTTNCSVAQAGLIIVEVYADDGSTGMPGQEIRARWADGESRFFTGLKPEKGAAYADFAMEQGKDYIVDMPGHADPLPQPLSASPCVAPTGERTTISYRVVFRQSE